MIVNLSVECCSNIFSNFEVFWLHQKLFLNIDAQEISLLWKQPTLRSCSCHCSVIFYSGGRSLIGEHWSQGLTPCVRLMLLLHWLLELLDYLLWLSSLWQGTALNFSYGLHCNSEQLQNMPRAWQGVINYTGNETFANGT